MTISWASLRCRLQWGRGISAAELQRNNLLFRRGDCFNGAAAFQPRNWVGASPTGAPSPGFNGAAAFQPRNYDSAASLLDGGGRFNGAAAFQPRNYSTGLSDKEPGSASMGPRHFSRGILSRLAETSPATWLQWGRGISAAELRRTCIF